ncbi:MAG: N-acetylmuramoyl-L-alanine amidase [Thermotogota bacterium]
MKEFRKVVLHGGQFNIDNAFVLAGVAFDIGTRVIKWYEKEGFNQYLTNRSEVKTEDRKTGKVTTKVIKGNRYSKRVMFGDPVKAIRQFFIHHSGGDGRNPSGMYETLQNQRGLSVHFAAEDDGRIYQFLDAVECAWHGGGHNKFSIGVESCLFPDAAAHSDYYSGPELAQRGNLPHTTTVETLQGVKRTVFCFTAPQVQALSLLAAGCWYGVASLTKNNTMLCAPPRFPRVGGAIPREVYAGHAQHSGLIGHLQCTDQKWDPAGFPWEMFEAGVGSAFSSMSAAAMEV